MTLSILLTVALLSLGESIPSAADRKPAVMPSALSGDSLIEAYAFNRLGFLRSPRPEVIGALNYFLDSLAAKRAAGDAAGEARVLHDIGVIYMALGENGNALRYLTDALALRRKADGQREQAATLQALALVQTSLDDYEGAMTSHVQALQLMRALADHHGEAYELNGAGRTSLESGDPQEALRYFAAALETSRSIADRRAEAHTLNNLGALYQSLGELNTALGYYTQALSLKREIGDEYGRALVLNNLGVVESELGNSRAALSHFENALPAVRAAGDQYAEGSILNNLGVAFSTAGESIKARDAYTTSLNLRRAVGDRRGEALTLFNLARADSSAGQANESLLRDSLTISSDIGDTRGEIAALEELARIDRDGGRLAEARRQLERALDLVETARGGIVSRDLRASFSASRQSVYELYIDVLMRSHLLEPEKGYDAAALAWSEQSRARGLLELLSDRRDRIAGADPVVIECERSLERQIAARADHYMRLLSDGASREQASSTLQDLEQLKTEYARLEAEVRAKSPRYAALTQPAPARLDEMRQLAGRDAVIFEYLLGDDRSYLWTLTADRLRSYALPRRSVIESVARSAYALLNARNTRLKFETDDERRDRVRSADREYWAVAARLGRMILGPAEAELHKKTIILIADGALHYIPFTALPVDGSEPLIVRHEVISIPSASALALLQRELGGRKRAVRELAVIADPVYDRSDSRIRPDRRQASMASAMTTADHESKSRFDPQRLPFTREEADSILSLVPQKDRRLLADFAATREAVTHAGLVNYRLVHFATHAWIDDVRPEISALVLSLYDTNGRQQDGYIRLHELFNLSLNADLVVLSACRTALGRELRSEGMVGLARGFMYAGARRLMVSLWSVNDRSTAELMKRFYTRMLEKNEGPSAALRAAEISMRKDKRWRSPYYWAPFIITGEPDTPVRH